MPKLHDAGYRSAIQARIRQLRPDSQRRWGKMSVGQMLWHVNEAMEAALGRVQLPPTKAPLPRPLMKFIVINIPWPKGAPTLPTMGGGEGVRIRRGARTLSPAYRRLRAKRIDADWPSSPMLGRMSGTDVTRLHAKHLDHHLKQFGV